MSSQLNEAQGKAVESESKVILCLAGAGTGKTSTLTSRIAHLQEQRISCSNMLALTFTRLAGKEMKERVIRLVGASEGEKLFCNTFHAFCVKVLKEYGYLIGYDREFTIYDQEDKDNIIQTIINEMKFRAHTDEVTEYLNNMFNLKAKNYMDVKRAGDEYKNRLLRNNSIDLDGLLNYTLELMSKYPKVQEQYNSQYEYMFVDEFQDTNDVQMQIIKAFNPKNLFVVGDDYQCWDEESNINTPSGIIKVKDVKVGDKVLSMSRGELKYCEITAKNESLLGKKLILSIKTKHGKELRVTKGHKCFATPAPFGDYHYVYLMYKKNKGFRIGVSSGGLEGIIGARTNSERPNRLWLLSQYTSKQDALYEESRLSLKYGVPTNPFYHNGRNLGISQNELDKIFMEFGENGKALLDDLGYEFDYPHYIPQGTCRHNEKKLNVNLIMNDPHGVHVSFENDGFRLRKSFVSYKEARIFADQVKLKYEADIIYEKFRYEKGLYLNVIPANQLKLGMKIPVIENAKLILDEIISVVPLYESTVYHIEVAESGNLIADDVISHNCIYAWRQAKPEYIINFKKYYPECEVIKLEENYRSTIQIIEAANNLIAHNINQTEKVLKGHKEGAAIEYFEAETISNEVNIILSRILEDTSNYSDYAILTRTNKQMEPFMESFKTFRVPYQLVTNKDDPLKKRDVRMVLNILEVLLNPKDDMTLKKILNFPEKRVNDLRMNEIEKLQVDEGLSLFETLERVPELNDFMELLNNIRTKVFEEYYTAYAAFTIVTKIFKLQERYEKEGRIAKADDLIVASETISKWQEQQRNLGESQEFSAFIKWLHIRDIQEKLIEKNDAAKFMTVHASKGLEFKNVFVIGMNKNIFPSKRGDLEEERRLFYVAITRAKEKLYISRAKTVLGWANQEILTEESQFIKELERG